jgi:hypothetical protein
MKFMIRMSTSTIESGELAFLLDNKKGFAYFGIVRQIQPPLNDAEAGKVPGRVLMNGVKIGRNEVGVGRFRFTPVEQIRQPDPLSFHSEYDIPTEGWGYVCKAEPDKPGLIIDSLRQDGYTGFAEFLANHLNTS